MIDWANSLDWDWVISRQRIFATPIPVWYCKQCGETVVAKAEWTPIDPRTEPPRIDACLKCGSHKFTPETDVLDTWFDSSITCAVHAGWPDRQDWHRLFPADLHPSGYDIIRTWAYYLMVRHLALFDEKPYNTVLINGMVLGSDGRKMSKSLGNYVATPAVFDKYGADAPRQWSASGGATGSDIPFRWADVEYGWRFLLKLWNAARFSSLHLQDFDPQEQGDLGLLDRWLLSKMEKVTQRTTTALKNCQFNIATAEIRHFTWHQLCDQYIEAIKHRLYKSEKYGDTKRKAAQYTLYNAIYRVLQLLAPVSPHITEEIYQTMYAEEKKLRSIHVSPWPLAKKETFDETVEKQGDLIIAVISEVRKDKAERKKPLNTPIKNLVIYTTNDSKAQILNQAVEDIEGTCKTQKLEIVIKRKLGREVEGHPDVKFLASY
jgi:valyl-tRNA synthetase